jgi:hypothetical protein
VNNNRSKKFGRKWIARDFTAVEARSQYNGLLTKSEGASGGITVHIDRIGTVAVSKKR